MWLAAVMLHKLHIVGKAWEQDQRNVCNCVFHWYAGAGVQGRLFWVPPTEWLFRALRPSLCSESSPFLVSKFFTTLSACLCLSVACLSVCLPVCLSVRLCLSVCLSVRLRLKLRCDLGQCREVMQRQSLQFRAVQKRLLARFKDKTPSGLSHLDTLLEGTYRQVQYSTHRFTSHWVNVL